MSTRQKIWPRTNIRMNIVSHLWQTNCCSKSKNAFDFCLSLFMNHVLRKTNIIFGKKVYDFNQLKIILLF